MNLFKPFELVKKASRSFLGNKSDNTDGSASRDPDTAQDVPTNTILTNTFPTNIVPTNILTFRKISTMLSFIQHNETYEITGTRYRNLKPGEPQRLQIKVCSAFSSVSVMDAEVVATVAIPTAHGLEVIVCSKFVENKPSRLRQASSNDDESPKKGRLEALLEMLVFVKNPERDDPKPPQEVTLYDGPKLFPSLVKLTDKEIIEYIEESW